MDGAVAVAVDVAGPLRGQLERVVEGALGWQVVGAEDVVLPPRCVLVDVDRVTAHAGGPTPLVLLVTSDDDPVRAARVARHVGSVLAGVPDVAALVAAVEQTATVAAGRAAWCTVAGAAGGVGATTVATALGALRAWHHGPTLVAVSGPTHQEGAPRVAPADLVSPAAWAAAAPVVGVTDCRVVGVHGGALPADAGAVPVVLERGVLEAPVDVLVVRSDRAGLAAAAAAPAATVVVVGRGPLGAGRIRSAVGASTVVELPWSARVAAAAAAGRLPADVPGTWLQPLVPVVAALADRDLRP